MRSSAAILGRCSSPVYFRFGPDTAEQRAKISVRFAAKQSKSRRSAFGHFPPLVCFAPIPAVRTGSRGRRERTLAGLRIPRRGHSAFGQLRPLRLTGSMSESGQSCLSRIRGEHPLTDVIRTEDYMLIACSHGKISGSHCYLYASWFRFPSRL